MIKKNRLVQFLKLSLSIIVIVALVKFSLENYKVFESLFNLSILHVLFLVIIYLLTALSATMQFSSLLNNIGCFVPFKVSFIINAYNSFLNLVLPLKSGLAYRGYILNKHYDLEVRKYIEIALHAQLVLMLFPLMFLVVFCTYIYVESMFVAVIIGGGLALATIIFYRADLKAYFSSFVWAISFHLFWALLLYGCFLSLELQKPFLSVLALHCFLSFSSLLNLTPGNIGIKEGLAFMVSDYFGISGTEAVAVVLLERAIYTCSILLLGLLSHVSTKKLKFSRLN